MTGKLQDKVAIVTGAASGFGRGIAELFALEGARVVAADINGEGARQLAAALGNNVIAVSCDVSKKADVDAMVRAATEAFGGLDIVVNNAGITHRNQPLLDVGEAEFDRIYAVNVKSIYLSTLAAVPEMEQRGGGTIINIASTAGIRPRPGLTWYNGSKGAVITLTKSMAVELAPKNIRVNAINPVMGETGMLTAVHGPARYAGESRQVHRRHSARAPVAAIRHRERGAVPRRARVVVHYRRRAGGRRRSLHLIAPRQKMPARQQCWLPRREGCNARLNPP